MILELRILERTFNEVAARQELVARAIVDSNAALEAVRNLSSRDLSQALISLGGGVYVRTDVPKPSSLVVSLGANVAVEKNQESTVGYLEERARELQKLTSSLDSQRIELARRLEVVRNEINVILAERQKV